MNFQHLIDFAKKTDADLVIAALPVNEEDAKRMGIMKLDKDGFITEFYEKPQEQKLLNHLRLPTSTLEQIARDNCDTRQFLGSMGIYVFKRQVLLDLLKCDSREDFGKHIIPTKVSTGNIAAYIHNGYWEDIGTIESFFKANIALTAPNPEFNCCEDKKHMFLSHIKSERRPFNSGLSIEGRIIEKKSRSCSLKSSGTADLLDRVMMYGLSQRALLWEALSSSSAFCPFLASASAATAKCWIAFP